MDVAILEVGLGGRLDATNCVREPVVCGVTPLGFDHMALLGHTLPEIAREKAGIFKRGVPALSVAQRPDAHAVLEEVAEKVSAPLRALRPLDEYALAAGQGGGPASAASLELGLAGEHQRQNAALAVALAAEWEARSGVKVAGEAARKRAESVAAGVLPPEYAAGLQLARWPGRGQIVGMDAATGQVDDVPNPGLTFFLDGAHTVESMATCAAWFADASAAAARGPPADAAPPPRVHRVLLFNCMEVSALAFASHSS